MDADYGGYFWSKMATSKHVSNVDAHSAYRLGFYNKELYTSGGPRTRWVAVSLRCLKLRTEWRV